MEVEEGFSEVVSGSLVEAGFSEVVGSAALVVAGALVVVGSGATYLVEEATAAAGVLVTSSQSS